jgi:hypothetical protein
MEHDLKKKTTFFAVAKTGSNPSLLARQSLYLPKRRKMKRVSRKVAISAVLAEGGLGCGLRSPLQRQEKSMVFLTFLSLESV